MPYEFRILGPVGFGWDGETARLGAPKRQAMLAALLLEANQPVPLPQLISAMWPGPAPRSATANLRSHAWHLRRWLDGRLAAPPGGYELRVQEAELDADRFAELASAGRAALAGRQPAAALTRLSRALGLWHGSSAGDGLARGSWLDARLSNLDEQRLDVFEDHASARLHTRDFPAIVADLREHLVRWPVRERCWELLILALYRSGDPAAALVAYQQARATLTGQLGIEPGSRLRRLQRAVLHRDPALDPAAPRESVALVPAPVPVPDPRPVAAPELIGRETQLAVLVDALRDRSRLIVVSGPAGVGKSALATRAAGTVADKFPDCFPDGQVTVDLGSSGGTRAAGLAAVIGALGRPVEPVPRTGDELVAQYRSLVAGQRMLIMLDNVADPGLVHLLRSEGLTLLVISRRRRLPVDAANQVEVRPLTGRYAIELLTRYAGAARTGADPDALREVVRVCDGLPLALQIAGRWLAGRPYVPLPVFATRLARKPLDGLGSEHPSVRDTLAADLRAVAVDYVLAPQVFPLLGLSELATPEQLGRELDADPDRVFFTLEHLVDRCLVESPQPQRYQAVGLPHAYAIELAESQQIPKRADLGSAPATDDPSVSVPAPPNCDPLDPSYTWA